MFGLVAFFPTPPGLEGPILLAHISCEPRDTARLRTEGQAYRVVWRDLPATCGENGRFCTRQWE